MTTDPKTPPGKPTPSAPAAKADEPAKATAARKEPAGRPPPFDERKLRLAELVPFGSALVADDLVAMLRDGRALVRANAALGLAAAGHAPSELVLLVRDSDAHVATSTAEAIAKLGRLIRPLIPQIVLALDGALPEVVETVVSALAELIGGADDELTAALDVPLELADRTVIESAGKVGKAGIAFLIKAATAERSRIRINAVAGLGRFGKTDADAAMAFLTQLETTDPVPDVRTAVKQAMLAVVAREKQEVVDHLPKNIPDFEARKLSASELAEYADVIDVDQMIFALQDGRDHVRINASRSLGVKGAKGARAAGAMGLLLRDSVAQVRREVAKALGKLGAGAIDAANDLVGALGDTEDEVVEGATSTLAALGEQARAALVRGLETGDEAHGLRVGALIGRLPGAAETLSEAFTSPAVNVQVNAALGLGLLEGKVGVGLRVLHGARTGGDARTRAAVRRALDMIEPRGATGPKPVQVPDFEERALSMAELEKHKAELERVGPADLIAYLEDGRDVVRTNAATSLGLLGAAATAAGAARGLGVRLRDDAARARLAATQALDKLGDAAVLEAADDLVGALGDTDDKVAAACAAVLRARKARMLGALIRGLETDKPNHGRRIVELINVFEDASETLCDAIESPAVNVQVNAALGLGLLGDRVGKGRKALETRRTGGDARTREAVRAALETLDGPAQAAPGAISIDGFESRILGAEAFADPKLLRVEDLAANLQDGRPVVRANAATALGVLGAAALPAVRPIAVLLRDDDSRVRIHAATALDKLGDDAVREIAEFLVGALRGDAEVAKTVAKVLAARKARVLTALVKGLETDDDTHARRIIDLICVLPDACEILCDAFESPAENVQVNAAIGLGVLGAKRAGTAGRKLLEGSRTRGFTRTKEAVFKALAMLDAS